MFHFGEQMSQCRAPLPVSPIRRWIVAAFVQRMPTSACACGVVEHQCYLHLARAELADMIETASFDRQSSGRTQPVAQSCEISVAAPARIASDGSVMMRLALASHCADGIAGG
jgi:hypothetical protein